MYDTAGQPRRRLRRCAALAGIVAGCFCAAGRAQAQAVSNNAADAAFSESNDVALTVQERQARRERKRGVQIGAVHVQPSASVRIDYNTNVFAAPSPDGDAIVTLSGKVVGDFDTGRNAGSLTAEVSRATYTRLSSENGTQWRVAATDTLRLPYDIGVSARASYASQLEPRTSSGAPVGAGRPVRADTAEADMELTWRGGRLLVAMGGNAADYRYQNTVMLDGSGLVQRFRDYRYYEVHGRVAYDIGGPQVFVAADRHWVRYRTPQPGTGLDRDTQGWRATVGLSSDITPLLRGTLSVGYLHEAFDLASAAPVSAFAFNAALDWLVTPITTIRFTASRRLENGAALDANGYVSSRLGLRVDHELTRSILLDFGLGYENAAFRTIDRTDNLYSIDGGLRLQLAGGLFAGLREAYQWRQSAGTSRGFDFRQSVTSANVGYQY